MSADLGQVVALRADGHTASVVTVGASLSALEQGGRPLVVPFAPDRERPVFRGAVLAPWPNRVVDGRYTFAGETRQLPLSEPDRGHALHGLLAWASWEVEAATDEAVALTASVTPSEGYPHALAVRCRYVLGADGLTTTVTAVNTGTSAAPYGVSAHPYLTAGGAPLGQSRLTLPARRWVETEGPRLLPRGERPVAEAPFPDFSTPTPIGDAQVDHAFTGLVPDADGRVRVRLAGPDGFTTTMSWGPDLPWVQIHTADRPEPELDRAGLAVEPMSCPPDAFNSGQDLVVLQPGDEHSASWTIGAEQG